MTTMLSSTRIETTASTQNVQLLGECQRMALIIGVYVSITLNILLSCFTLVLVIYLDDSSRQFKQMFGYAGAIILMSLNVVQAVILQQKKYQFANPIIIILLICGVLLGMFMGILQLSERALQNNGSGKIPLVNPHTENWYRIDKTNTILTYIIALTTLLQEGLVFVHSRQYIPKDKSSTNQDSQMDFQIEIGSQIIYPLDNDVKIPYYQESSERIESSCDVDEAHGSINKVSLTHNQLQQKERSKVSSSIPDDIINSIPSRKQKALEQLQQNLLSFSVGSEKINTGDKGRTESSNPLQQSKASFGKSWNDSIGAVYYPLQK